jgi:hypothetical protein
MANTAKTSQNAKATEKNYYNELVKVKLFKDNDKYKDDVFVAVNGRGMIVPRGKEVEIPRKYAIALKNSEAQDSFAAEYSAELRKNADSGELA